MREKRPMKNGILAAVLVALTGTVSTADDLSAVKVETGKWQAAIDAASAGGGGTVTIPEGRHVTGGLFLRDNVTLKLEKGAVLEGVPDGSRYAQVDLEFVETRSPWSALIMATNAVNVAVVGEGRLFGNGGAFPPSWESVGRPRGLIFYRCRNVRLEDVTIHDMGSWTCYFKECDGVTARRVTIDSHVNRNNDGFDIDSRNVLIEDCTVDGSDDGICLKSDNPSFTVENVTVRNCTVASSCNALKIGTGSHGNFRNILFENVRTRLCSRFGHNAAGYDREKALEGCRRRFKGCSSPYSSISAIAIENVDGGKLENVTFRNIEAEGARVPIFIRAGLRTGRRCGIPAGTGRVMRGILLENVRGTALSQIACSITGVKGLRLEDVTLRNVRLTFPGGGLEAPERGAVPEVEGEYPEANMFGADRALPAYAIYARHVDGLKLENVTASLAAADERKPIVIDDVNGFSAKNCSFASSDAPGEMQQLPGGGFVFRDQVVGIDGSGVFAPGTRRAFRDAFDAGFSCAFRLRRSSDGVVYAANELTASLAGRPEQSAWKGDLETLDVGALWGDQTKGAGDLRMVALDEILSSVPENRTVVFDVEGDAQIAADIVSAFRKSCRTSEDRLMFFGARPALDALRRALPSASYPESDIGSFDDPGLALDAFAKGAKMIRTARAKDIWREMREVVDAANGKPIDREAVKNSYWRRSGAYEPVTPRIAGALAESGLHGRVAATLDYITGTNAVGSQERAWKARAWRNERVHGQFVVWTCEKRSRLRWSAPKFTGPDGAVIGGDNVKVRFVRYTLAEVEKTVMRRRLPAAAIGDILDDAEAVDMPAGGFRPVWVTVKVPGDAPAGIYRGTLELAADRDAKISFPLELEVIAESIPEKPTFFLDYWQRPHNTAAYHGVKLWSDEHFALMRPIYEELAAAGQKVVWALVVDDLWHRGSGVRDRAMISRTRKSDGSWSFDFSVLDRYVDFCRSCGIGPQIHLYSMLRFQTWSASNMVRNHTLDHVDAGTGAEEKYFFPDYDSPEFEAYWAPFLRALERHVKEKKWTGDVYMAADEMNRKVVGRMVEIVRRHAPSVRFAMANDRDFADFKEIGIANFSQALRPGKLTPAFLDWVKERKARGEFTTFYTCNIPAHPNNWATSPLAEQEWMGLFAAATGMDGMLRWAACSWTRAPMWDTTVDRFEPGETQFIYPGARVSPRWEILRDSIENYEKIMVLRKTGRSTAELEKALADLVFVPGMWKSSKHYRAKVDAVYRALEKADL